MQATITVAGDCIPVKSLNVDGNGGVDLFDILTVVDFWGPCPVLSGLPCTKADVNSDGLVNIFDIFDVIDGWTG
jgi:hypothetical protein